MKKPTFLSSLLFAIIFIACNNESPSERNIIDKKESFDFIRTFEGKINNKYPILAKIQSNAGQISGSYLYTKVGQQLELKGIINNENTIEIEEFDEKGNQTGLFKGELVNKNKIEGMWSKPNGKNPMPFFLIESNTNYESAKKKKEEFPSKNLTSNSIKILYWQEEYDEKLDSNVPKLKINENFLKTADDGIRAIIAYYSLIAGTECWWANDKPNSNMTNLDCKLTSALKLGYQCSESQKSFVRKWFSEEEKVLEKIDGCYSVPYTATSRTIFEFLKMEINGDKVSVRFKTNGANVRTESFWETEGEDVFKIKNRRIKLISSSKN